MSNARSQCSTFRDVEQFLVQQKVEFGKDCWLVKAELFDMWPGEQSNAHSAPVGREKNWLRTDNRPKHYNGFRGRIRLTFAVNSDSPIYTRDVLSPLGANTGTGGFVKRSDSNYLRDVLKSMDTNTFGVNIGSGFIRDATETQVHEYEVILWSEDFPLIPFERRDCLIHNLQRYEEADLDYRTHNWVKYQSNVMNTESYSVMGWSEIGIVIHGWKNIQDVVAMNFGDEFEIGIFLNPWSSAKKFTALGKHIYVTNDVDEVMALIMKGEITKEYILDITKHKKSLIANYEKKLA